MTVDDLIQQQASRNHSSECQKSEEEQTTYKPESLEDDVLFRTYHLKGYAVGPGFSIESF